MPQDQASDLLGYLPADKMECVPYQITEYSILAKQRAASKFKPFVRWKKFFQVALTVKGNRFAVTVPSRFWRK